MSDAGPPGDIDGGVNPACGECALETPVCDPDTQSCVECTADAHCDNGVFCDGPETCSSHTCTSGEDPCQHLGENGACRESSDQCLPPSVIFIHGDLNPEDGDFTDGWTVPYEHMVSACHYAGRGESWSGYGLTALPWIALPERTLDDELLAFLGPDRKFVLPDGTLVAENWADLTDGSLLAAINQSPGGDVLPSGRAWTGIDAMGQHTDAADCEDWTSNASSSGTYGEYGSTGSTWTNGGTATCENAYAIYCFQVFPSEFDVKRAFITSMEYRPGLDFSSVEDAQAICETLGRTAVNDASTNWDVWLSRDDILDPAADPAGRFTQHDGPYVNLNGFMVAANYDDLTDGYLNDVIYLTELGTTIPEPWESKRVWTATQINGQSSADDCQGWTSSSSLHQGGAGSLNSTVWWTQGDQDCSQDSCNRCLPSDRPADTKYSMS